MSEWNVKTWSGTDYRDFIDVLRGMNEYTEPRAKTMHLAADAIEELLTLWDKQRWIPVSERLPEEPYGCLVTVWDTNQYTMDGYENLLPYFVGWDGEQWNDDDGEQCPFEVIAWMPLPEPFGNPEQLKEGE